MDLEAIKDDKAVLMEMEKYANAGMEILLEEFLSDYLMKNKTELKLNPADSKELPKALLHFVYERLE
jgi:hypothetical protein